jgi:putative transposase
VLFFIEHGARRLHLDEITAYPTSASPIQPARNPHGEARGQADSFKFLIQDRNAECTAEFDAVFTVIGVRIIKTPVQSLARERDRRKTDGQGPP